MKKRMFRTALALASVAALTVAVAGCSTGSAPSGKTAITVAIPGTYKNDDGQKFFAERLAAFQKAHPEISVKSIDVQFDATTFQALVAGGNLPTTMEVPFTETQALIANGQVADLTTALDDAKLTSKLNELILPIAQNSSGDIFGVPSNSYSVGLNYNRAIFTQAGLDPDSPPTTWDEVRADSKAIFDATGIPGFGQMTKDGTGGWMFSAETYSFGGTVENADGTKATFADTPSEGVLTALHDMRWTDGSMSTNALYDYGTIIQDLAAGKLGMYIGTPDMYAAAVGNFGMDPKDWGSGPMPIGSGPGGTLNGGAVEIVSPTATAEETAAALQWIDFFYLGKYTDEKAAVDDAKTKAAAKNPVGLPGLSPVSEDSYAEYLGWIKPYVNVPTENFDPYIQGSANIPLVPEPKAKAQEVYATLDAVLQTVLTDKNADLSKLLSDAADAVSSKLGR
jgi:ABC-type glycerol-3-phosphate transport system substrate-binding protein